MKKKYEGIEIEFNSFPYIDFVVMTVEFQDDQNPFNPGEDGGDDIY